MKDSNLSTLRLGASAVLGACIMIAAISVHSAAGMAHAATIAVMGFIALVTVQLKG